MSAVEPQKVADTPAAGTVEPAPAPVEPVAPVAAEAPAEPKVEEPKAETEAVAPVEEKKEEEEEKPTEKVVEPIYSGALGYKAPGLKNAFRFSKKYFWFGEEPVPASNLSQYLRGEKPEIAHPVVAWSTQTGKGLLYFVKHADQKETPAGALNLAYATDLVKDGTIAFTFKISGHKHAFEAQTAPERDGWFVAVEKAIADAQTAKEGIESSEGYKEHKEKLSKPAALAVASASTPKKSTDATAKAADTEAPATEETVAAPARAGSSSSSSSDEEKKAKKSKSKSRSVSRGKRASIFGGFLGKKEKVEEKIESKKAEHKDEPEAAKTEPEVKKEETPAVAATPEVATTAPVITEDIPKASEELKTETAAAPVTAPAAEPTISEEPTTKPVEEKPKVSKRGSVFGSFLGKLHSPTTEKKESEVAPLAAATPAKTAEPTTETAKPLEEAQVAAPPTETTTEAVVPKTEEAKPATAAVSTPTKEKEHFSFGKFFGKDRAKSPAATEKKAPEVTDGPKIDAVAPRIEDTPAPAPAAATEPEVPAPAAEKTEPVEEKKAEEKKDASPKKDKRGSISGFLTRALSTKKEKKEKKEATAPATVPETAEDKEAAPAPVEKDDTPTAAPTEKPTIGDVVPEAVTVGEAPKSTPAVATTA